MATDSFLYSEEVLLLIIQDHHYSTMDNSTLSLNEASPNRGSADLPKVLIVGQPFNSETGGGITLSNLFRGWDKDRLAVICSAHLINQGTDMESCTNYYQLGQREIKWIFPFNLLKREHYSGPIRIQSAEQVSKTPASSLRNKLIMEYFYPALEFAGIYHQASSVNLSKELCAWIDAFQPDVVYAQATTRAGLMLCRKIQSYLKKPFIFHMMDDWPSMLRGQGPFGRYWENKVNGELKALFDSSDLLMTISDGMAKAYKLRYGKDSAVFHNPIDVDFWKQHRRTDFALESRPTLLYAGRVGTGIDASLETIAQAIEQTNKDLGSELSFVLQTAEKPPWIAKYACVKHRSFVPYEELPRAFASADFLVLPYDFSEKSIQFIGFSMPTKAPEYMASGTPIIVFSPEETALVQYVRRFDCAEIITENSVEALKSSLKKLMQQESLRRSLSLKAAEAVDHNHDAQQVKRQFKEQICRIHKR